jgi:hypothetical protein
MSDIDERRPYIAYRVRARTVEILSDLIEDIDELLAQDEREDEDEEQPSQVVLDLIAKRQSFKVGDYIQVRVNMECAYCVDARFPRCVAEAVGNDGWTGTITIVDPDTPHDPTGCWCNYGTEDAPDEDEHWMLQRHTHRYWVKFDTPEPWDFDVVNDIEYDFDQHYAPTELELIDG